ncbi:MAG: lipocalin-like domain-containing protein [Paraprevotella sp.]|nr:lipocalin-like domain-containing protein [Paraprevotella sp.]
MDQMKTWLYGVLGICLTAVLSAGCMDKAPENPVLEGYWKQERIGISRADTAEECRRLFWAFQLGVSELDDQGENGFGTYVCRYDYNKGASTLRMYNFRLKSDQSQLAPTDKLKYFGIPSEDVTFNVLKLNDDNMILCAGDTVLYFRSF